MGSKAGVPSDAAATEEDNDEWEDEGDWDDGGEDETARSRATLPDGWSCTVGRGESGRYFVAYHTEHGNVLNSKKAMQSYLETRPDLNAEQVLSVVDFSQKFGHRAFLLGLERMDSRFQPMSSQAHGTAGGDASQAPPMGADPERPGSHLDATAQDEQLARTMQAAFDEEARMNGYSAPSARLYGEDVDDDDDDDASYDGEEAEIGEVAAGGWRMREAQHDEECAEDHDISCLEVRTVLESEEGHCPVCQEEWHAGDQQRVLPCEHRFHASCVDRWLKQHKAQCPLCKKDVREDWEDEGEEVWDPVAGKWVPVGGGRSRAPEAPPPEATAEGGDGEDDGGSEGSWETVDSDA